MSLTPSHWLSIHGLVSVIALLVYVTASHVLHQRRHPAAAISWALFMRESLRVPTRFTAWFDLERSSAHRYVPRQPGLWRDIGEGLVLWIAFQL